LGESAGVTAYIGVGVRGSLRSYWVRVRA
jgi:hypothetical protein